MRPLVLLSLAALLAACGPAPRRDRGDDDEGAGAPPLCAALGTCPFDAGPSGEAEDPEEPGPDPDGWPAEWVALEEEMLRLVNELRTQGGQCPSGARPPVAPLTMDPALRTAARLHSKDMGEQRYFSHTGLDGSDPFERMQEAGYDGQPQAENIAAGSQTAAQAFQQWLSSDGHCRNMTAGSYDEIGVGFAFVDGSPFGAYWTQTFGSR